MPCIADSKMHDQFVKMLSKCEEQSTHLDSWEQRFVEDVRERYQMREDQADLGMSMWNPSRDQWNTLHGIYHKVS